MISLRNTKLGALAAVTALGIGAAASPIAAIAASHPTHATKVSVDRTPDKAGVKDTSKPDLRTDKTSADKASSVDHKGLDR